MLLTAQADGNYDSSGQRAHRLIDSAAKKWEEKKGENIIDYHFSDSSRVRTEASPKSWMGKTSAAWGGPEKVPAQGRAQAFKAFKSNPLIQPKKIKQKAIICYSAFSTENPIAAASLWNGMDCWVSELLRSVRTQRDFILCLQLLISVMESPGQAFIHLYSISRRKVIPTWPLSAVSSFTPVLQTLGNTGTTLEMLIPNLPLD